MYMRKALIFLEVTNKTITLAFTGHLAKKRYNLYNIKEKQSLLCVRHTFQFSLYLF